MKTSRIFSMLALLGLVCAGQASAAYLFEIDTDGADDGVITYNPRFSFGGDTTTASQSAPSLAFGTNGADSIFGGNGVNAFDTYIYNYSPPVDGDNLPIAAGTSLGEGWVASGLTAGGVGEYFVYATWPFTTNVSGGLVNYNVATPGDAFTVQINQNDFDGIGVDGRGNEWVRLGKINYTSGAITVVQTSSNNTFVSMRAYGLLFEPVPEPAGLGLIATGLLATFGFLRRR